MSHPAPIVAPARRSALRISVVEGMSAQVHSALTGLGIGGNAVTVGFALVLGASDFALGLLAALPPLASAMQLVSASLLMRLGQRRAAVVLSSTVARLLLPLAGLLPLLQLAGETPLVLFVTVWGVANALLGFSTNLWVSWMADLVPPRTRARYFSRRTAASTLVGIIVSLLAGQFLDAAGEGEDRLTAFSLVFLAAAVAGAGCGALLWRQPEPIRTPTAERRATRGWRAAMLQPFQEARSTPGLGGVVVFVGIFGLSNGIASPFWQPYQLEQLQLSYTYVNGILALVQGAVTMLAVRWWGGIAARYGHRSVVVLCVALICTHPFYYLVATPERTWPVLLDSVSSGLAWSGYNLCIFNLVLSLARGPRLERLFAVYATVAGLAQALSAVLSGAFSGLLPASLDVGWMVLDRRQLIFVLTFVARALCLVYFIRRVPEGRPGQMRAVLVAIPHYVKARVADWRFLPRA